MYTVHLKKQYENQTKKTFTKNKILGNKFNQEMQNLCFENYKRIQEK